MTSYRMPGVISVDELMNYFELKLMHVHAAKNYFFMELDLFVTVNILQLEAFIALEFSIFSSLKSIEQDQHDQWWKICRKFLGRSGKSQKFFSQHLCGDPDMRIGSEQF